MTYYIHIYHFPNDFDHLGSETSFFRHISPAAPRYSRHAAVRTSVRPDFSVGFACVVRQLVIKEDGLLTVSPGPQLRRTAHFVSPSNTRIMGKYQVPISSWYL